MKENTQEFYKILKPSNLRKGFFVTLLLPFGITYYCLNSDWMVSLLFNFGKLIVLTR
jgi:hypothetical protein